MNSMLFATALDVSFDLLSVASAREGIVKWSDLTLVEGPNYWLLGRLTFWECFRSFVKIVTNSGHKDSRVKPNRTTRESLHLG